IYVYSSDTDFTPFDTGAYASSTTYVSGNAVKKAAEKLRDQILDVASEMLLVEKNLLFLKDGKVFVKGDDGRSVSLKDIGLRSLYVRNQRQIEASASFVSPVSPPPFAAHFAEVEVDEATGFVKVLRYVVAVDCGKVINPPLAKGQVLGAIANGIGYALFEEMKFNGKGKLLNGDLSLYKIITAADMPPVDVIFVETDEPTGPFGAKSVAEICINGPIPAIANAIYDAVGVRLWENPFTPERVLKALRG
ncbi:MAG: xanthine dehydrogenase family protein molybdopterin-binding subunit, partial [Synergistetes bacterium]|nr:xanthine dehydrogenase family protein molybdopterin-binding subunit [Synergistota bacterium]